jgi:signal transduction histidine kinase
MGLGLSIARRAVEASGGHIDVRDQPGVGCTFTIDLPRLA